MGPLLSLGSIVEAQAWEYKLIEVQDWLANQDILLTSHLEQELTVDDLPDESQVRPLNVVRLWCCMPRSADIPRCALNC